MGQCGSDTLIKEKLKEHYLSVHGENMKQYEFKFEAWSSLM